MFNRELKFTEQEEQYIDVVEKLIDNSTTKIHIQFLTVGRNCLVSNEEHHFKILLDQVGITLQNGVFSLKNRLREKFLEYLKEMVVEKNNSDIEGLIGDITSRETELIKNMQNIL